VTPLWRPFSLAVFLLLAAAAGCTDIVVSDSDFFFRLDASSGRDVQIGEEAVWRVSFGDGRCDVTWSSADPAIARVRPDGRGRGLARGRVFGVSHGTTVITIVARCAETGPGRGTVRRLERRREIVVLER